MESIPISYTGWLLFSSRCFKVDTYKIHTLLKLSRRGKGNNSNKKDEERRVMLLGFCFFVFWHWNGIFKCKYFKGLTRIPSFAEWASFSGVISPWILRVFLRGAQEANHKQTKRRRQCLFPTTLFLPLEGALSTPSLRMWKQTRWVCYLHLLAFSRVSGTKQGSRASWRLAWREREAGWNLEYKW